MKVVLVIVFLALALSLMLSYPVMLLWNLCLVPAIPAIMPVGWLQMWGISILISLLFAPVSIRK